MKNGMLKKVLSAVLAFALIASPVAGNLLNFTASAATQTLFGRVSDHESIDYWKGYFSNGQINSSVWSDTVSTKTAGAVWTDKSVFVPNNTITIDGVNVPVADTQDNFLVSMSVMASNKTVRGYEYIPTSTMLVLDVSASMGNGNNGNRSWDEMVQAANKAIDTLLNLNENNQVGVVLYSGNSSFGDSDIGHSTVLLPLNRYTTTATNNNGTNNYPSDDYPEYLTANNSSVGVNSAVRPRTTGSKSVSGGTYIQGGIYRAMEELIAADAPKTVTDGVQAGMAYTPIMVLMSDGAPTAANLDYAFNGNDSDHETDIGDGGSTDERMGFLTQLTAAYAKARIAEAYEKAPFIYTLGLGLNSLSDNDEAVAEAVLNPSASSGNIRTYWNTYLQLANNRTMYLNSNNRNPVVKSEYVTADFQNYVTQYFEAQASNNVTLEQALLNAFQQIVDMIVLQSVYYPTEIGGGSADLGGYVTFRDELGEYMDVRSVKGFLFEDENGNQILHTGAALAKNFVAGGGDLGQSSNPKPLGDELVRSVKERLGIEDTVTAQNLIRNAYYYGQLSYTDANNFSNYIGWYGDADGKFVDFWHEGHTEAEENAAMAKGAKFIYKSYCYLGEVNEDLGIKASDMMYTAIRVRKTLAAVAGSAVGEIVVEGSIPASLIPTITYQVSLNGKTYESGVNSLTITDTSADFPARILYEVGPRADINPINIAEKVNANHKNNDGTYTFYTNDWETVAFEQGEIADTSVNAFTHFEPAIENERYYYLTDSVVYQDANGTPYTGATKPSGANYYHANRVFSTTNGVATATVTYVKSSAEALSHAERSGSGWVIPAGTGKHEIVGYEVFPKVSNNTDTNRFTAYPKIKTDATGTGAAHSHHYSVVTFGNNGKLTVTPATGIKLTKALDAPSTTAQQFEFKISGANANEDYTATPVDAEGNFGTAATVTADANGVITVNVEAGTSIYITGLAAGTYTVTESDHTEYRVLTANGNATNQATVTVTAQQLSEALFVNTLKGYGNLYITKAVVGEALPAHATNAEFDITVDVGQTLAGKNYAAAHSGNTALTSVTVGQDGKITGLKIKHGQTIVIRNVPEGTTAVVTEIVYPSNYTPSYSSHNKAGETMDNDNTVTIEKNANATVLVENAYEPTPTSITVSFDSTKRMDATELTTNKTFEFVLEKYENGSWANVQTKTATVTAGDSNAAVSIPFTSLILPFDQAGVHSYRIYEKPGDATDGITYDPTIYTFVVTVTDVNGQLTATVTSTSNIVTGSGNNYNATVSFTNAYDTEPVIIDVQKFVQDASKDSVSPAGYEFELYTADANYNYSGSPFATDITDEEGKARFVQIVDKTQVGSHFFVLKEKVPAGYQKPAADKTGWHYDTKEVHIKVDVTVNGSDVIVEINDVVTNSAEFQFTNEYKTSSATLSLDTIATKTLNGRDMAAGEFTFELRNDAGTLLAEGKHAAAADGVAAPITFYKPNTTELYSLTYTKVGTYHYKISEVDGGKGGVDYTGRIFDLVVEVTDNGNGQLSAHYFFEDSTYESANFVNTYSVKTPTSIQLEATKKLTGGRPMLSSEFHFNVFEMTDNTFATKVSDTPVATGTNIGAEADGDGIAAATFKFSAIDYTQPGIHYYQISEIDQGSNLGISYDDTTYNVTVTVKDNLDGTITASADKTAVELVFTNEYKPTPLEFDVTADKLLTGRVLQAGEFEFALYEATVGANDVWTAGNQVGQNVTNADNGDISFPKLTFEKAGVYHYLAKEIAGQKGGIVYDDTQYRITVTVTDDHRGSLSAEAVIVNDAGELSQIVFNNTYTAAEGGIQLQGTKTLKGAKLKNQQFTFELYRADESFTALGDALQTAKNAADGKILFENLTFQEVGTYNYIVTEKNDAQKNYTYDDTVWCVSVEVTDDGEGQLIAETTIFEKGSTQTVTAFAFENVYKSETPKTGDNSNLGLWITLMLLSCAGFVGLAFTKKNRKTA